jgi:hypothetical protein
MADLFAYLPLLKGWRISFLGVSEATQSTSAAAAAPPDPHTVVFPSTRYWQALSEVSPAPSYEVPLIKEVREKGWLLDLYFEVEEGGIDYLIAYLYLDDSKHAFQPRRIVDGVTGQATFFGYPGTIDDFGYGRVLPVYVIPQAPLPYRERLKLTATNMGTTAYRIFNPIIRRIVIEDERLFVESARSLGLLR